MTFAEFKKSIRADIIANTNNSKGLIICTAYRTAAYLHRLYNRNRLAGFFCLPILFIYKIVIDYIMGVYIPPEAEIGKGLTVYHGVGLVVHPASIIGEYCVLRQGVTIGSRDGSQNSVPVIGSKVSIGAMAVLIGNIHIGDGAVIGAASVVLDDVPPLGKAVGNPASIR
ncbi:serine acetyltransferase [Novosphingobium sp. 1529]|uniref:serine O-acetyltransferase n=1 Tax=Novosphingobium sp. 1529 TaxID=3156424 RepID=UPI0033975293